MLLRYNRGMAFNLHRVALILGAALTMIAECCISYTLAADRIRIVDSDGTVHYFDISELYYQKLSTERLKECIKMATESIKQNPRDGMQYSLRGLAYWHLEQYKSAIQDLTKASQLLKEKTPFQVYRARGECYANLGDKQKAISEFTAGIQWNLAATECLLRRDEIYCQLGQYDKALSDATAIIKLLPKKAWPYKNRSVIYFHLGRYQDEIADLTKAIEIDNNEPIFYADRAGAYDKLGKHSLAEKDRKTCNEFTPEANILK